MFEYNYEYDQYSPFFSILLIFRYSFPEPTLPV